MWRALFILLVFAGRAAAGSPADAVRLAHADLVKQPAAVQPYLRYLTLYAVPDAERPVFLQVLSFEVNSLSREADLIAPRQVAPDLFVVNLLDYGWKANVYDKLADADPYFHTIVEQVVEVKDSQEYGYRTPSGAWVTTGSKPIIKKVKKKVTMTAPWLPTKEISSLILLTQSQAPILRADWFLVQTSIQIDRKAGYYDFLGVKKRDDLEKLVALDRKAAQRVRREIAAIVAESGVALNNRQIYRFQAITGGYWETRDTNNNLDRRNALRVLNGDFEHDAEEIYATLPNGLFVMAASDAKGALQDTVPDKIASDRTSTSNDLRIHPMLSCVRCHKTGLQPINDWARKFYRDDVQLTAVDYEKLRRLRQLYLGDLERWLKRDTEDYADVLKRTNGLTPAQNAKAMERVWQWYQDTSVTGEQLARELGVTWEHMLKAFKEYAAKANNLDVVLLGFLKIPEFTARREHIEEAYALAQFALKGVVP